MARYKEPDNITNNIAPIYEASLSYEAHGKCGTTVVLKGGEDWSPSGDAPNAWKLVVLNNGSSLANSQVTIFTEFTSANMSSGHDEAVKTGKYSSGTEIMANITALTLQEVEDMRVILYMDCDNS